MHNGESNFKIRCELESLCGGLYSTFASCKAHNNREHVNLLYTTLYGEEVKTNIQVDVDQIRAANLL